MKGVSALIILGICWEWASAQFLNHRPFPTYSLENMPETEFSCRAKILGGYYADADTQCQMFHICVKVAGIGVQDFRFLCPNGTAFDQDHQICAEWEDVDCDATTLYYSSDNFDLYRLGSGFESKAVKYGEEEETFALQRAETGDARLNREHQVQNVNQQKDNTNPYYKNPRKQQNNNHERDIFKGSSSSNFFNNRNNGKETDEDYDDNVNFNQDRDTHKRKIIRKEQRRPAQNNQQQNYDNQNQQNYNNQKQQNYNRPQQNRQPPKQQQNYDDQNYDSQKQQNNEVQTSRPTRPTGYLNNFAGSSYIPTTSRPTSTTINSEQFSTALNNHRNRQRQRGNGGRHFENTNSPTPTYTVSTPAPFRQTQQYNSPPNRQVTLNNNQYNSPTPAPKKQTDSYPSTATVNTQRYNDQHEVSKVKQTQNYPTTASQNYNNQYEVSKVKQSQPTQQYNKPTTPPRETENYPSNNPQYYEKKPTTPVKQVDNYPTTFPPKPKPFSQTFNSNPKVTDNFPTTFAPRTNAGYTQIAQQTTQYNKPNTQKFNNQFESQKSTQQTQQYTNQKSSPSHSTPRSTPFTQYTPTVPKIASTTPFTRSNRFDETQYDDGSYNSKYDSYDDKKEDEFLKTAHSQNIASSRNELAKTTRNNQPSTQKPYYESPRPFSVSPNTPKVTDYPKSTPSQSRSTQPVKNTQQQPAQEAKPEPPKGKKVKDVSYDYAYYDTHAGSEADYEIDTEIKKSTAKN